MDYWFIFITAEIKRPNVLIDYLHVIMMILDCISIINRKPLIKSSVCMCSKPLQAALNTPFITVFLYSWICVRARGCPYMVSSDPDSPSTYYSNILLVRGSQSEECCLKGGGVTPRPIFFYFEERNQFFPNKFKNKSMRLNLSWSQRFCWLQLQLSKAAES